MTRRSRGGADLGDGRRPSFSGREAAARDRARARGMSDFIVRRGVMLYGLPLVFVSLAALAAQGRLDRLDLETFVVRVLGPFVLGLLVARAQWAKIVRRRLDRIDRATAAETD